VKTFCLDMDMSGHTAASAVEAIELSLNKLKLAGLDLDGVNVSAAGLTGDTGGGAGLPNIFPLMVKDERILCRFATMMGCQMHALNNCLSNALKACFGDTGIGHNNAVQASYVYVLMIKRLKEELDSKGLDELMGLVLDEIKTNERWKNEASWQNKDGLSALFGSLDGEIDDEIDDDDIDEIERLFRGVQEPVFSRWATGKSLQLLHCVVSVSFTIYYILNIFCLFPFNKSSQCSRPLLIQNIGRSFTFLLLWSNNPTPRKVVYYVHIPTPYCLA